MFTNDIYLDITEKPIEELDLSVRTFNCLKRVGINTIGDVIKLSFKQLTETKNLGRKSKNEIISVIRKCYDSNWLVDEINDILECTIIEELDLSVRTFNCLKRAGINTIGDVIKLSFKQLTETKNLGRKSRN